MSIVFGDDLAYMKGCDHEDEDNSYSEGSDNEDRDSKEHDLVLKCTM